ncbi:c-type cytochrome [bacterium]|nr:c-type cytochrome [Rhodopirellula sp.]MDB4561433.1 c-type cytochrome [bacterium]MDB4770856.1 c-type cytochrome [bacterium]
MNKNVSVAPRSWVRKILILPVLLLACRTTTAEEDFSGELPRIPASTPQAALQNFSVAKGFEVQLVASEPLIASPVAIEWDAEGRLYVCEMRGYSEDRDAGLSRIRRLEDTNQDGRFDKSVVYADGLLWPTALFPYKGGLFVGDAPNLYYFRDDDQDGKADTKEVVLTGFGTSNVQGLMNSFRWGLDNRIHIACSSAAGKIGRPGSDKKLEVRGRDLAFDPDTYEIELTSGGGQHGMAFDDWGRKFVSSNSNHIQQVMYEDHYLQRNPYLKAPPARVSIAADGPQAEVYRTSPVEPWRIVRTRLRVGGLVPGPVEGGGRAAGYFTGATGVTIYRGDAWGPQWKGLAIIGDVGSNLVHRKKINTTGAQFIAHRIDEESEFVNSSDIWFRPAQFANAPDGTIYIIDVCREVIEHPKSLPPMIKKHLDLTAGRDRGRIYRIAPTDYKFRPTPNLRNVATQTLVDLLDHPNAWHRETAARLLYERQSPDSAETLSSKFKSDPTPLGRLHLLYAMAGQHNLTAQTIIAALRDGHPQVKRHALKLGENFASDPAMAEAFLQLASDPSHEVRIQLAFSAGKLPSNIKIPLLERVIVSQPGDRWLETAVLSSLNEGAGELFARLVQNNDFKSESAGTFLATLATQIGQQNEPADIEIAIEQASALPAANAPFTLPVIGSLTTYRTRNNHHLQRLAQDGRLDTLDILKSNLVTAAGITAGDEQIPVAKRVAATKSMRFGRLEMVSAPLTKLISNRQPHLVSQAAIETLGTFNSPTIANPLLSAWSKLSPKLRATATEVLFARNDRLGRLFDAVDSEQISLADIGTPRLQIAAKSRDSKIKSRANTYLSNMGSADRSEILDKYQAALTQDADSIRGRKLFTQHCSVCHKINGVGHEIGPNLASIRTRGAETILANVIDPNREVNPQYLNYVLLTQDGRAMTGMVASETASSVTLRRAESATDTVLRVDIEELKSTGLSIMPEGMEKSIDVQAMADIISYLMQP